jgi:hypothetical protein
MNEKQKYNDSWSGNDNVTVVGDAPSPWHGYVEAETPEGTTYYVEFRHLVPVPNAMMSGPEDNANPSSGSREKL